MRAAHRHLHHAVGAGQRRKIPSRERLAGGAEGQAGVGLPAGGQFEQRQILVGRGKQGHAKGQAVGAEGGRHRHRGVIQQVHEVGVIAQVRVEADRVGLHRGDGGVPPGGGGEDQVDVLPHGVAAALEGAQAILGVEGFDRGGLRAAQGDLPGDREDRFRLAFDEGLDGVVALGHPGAAIEQAGGFEEGLEVQFHRDAAQAFQPGDRIGEERRVVFVAKKGPLIRTGDAEAEGLTGREAPAVGLRRATVGVGLVEASDDAEHAGRVGGGEGEDRDRVQGPAGGHQPGGRQQAAGRLESDQVVEGRRHPTGAGGVGAQGKAHLTGGHRDRRTRAGTAGDIGRIEGVAAGAVGAAGAVEAGGELVQVGLAEGNRAGRDEARDHRRIGRGSVGEVRAAGGGRQAGLIDVVLHREGHAVQRQAGRVLFVQRAGAGQQLGLGQQADPGVVGVGDGLSVEVGEQGAGLETGAIGGGQGGEV